MKPESLNSDKRLIKFGTDGWRAIIAEDFTFENVRIVAQAYADFMKSLRADEKTNSDEISSERVVVGFDCRFLGKEFAREAAEVLRNNGFDVIAFEDPIPTPIVSWTVLNTKAVGGVVITASHNPAEFNGFKIKGSWGGSASPEITLGVESHLHKSSSTTTRSKKPTSNLEDDRDLIDNAISDYRAQIENLIDLNLISDSTESVVIDSMHGAGHDWIETFISGGKLTCKTIRQNRDPNFGMVDPEPIDRNLEALKKEVVTTNSLIGIGTDGDADRIGAVNEQGISMTMQEIFPILLLHLARNRNLSGGVVTTFSQSVLVKRIARALGFPLHETPIGFKYVADLMRADDILIGGEESGGFGIKGHIPERDAILSALLLLEAVFYSAKSPTEMVQDLHREFGEFHFARRDIKMAADQGNEFIQSIKEKGFTDIGGHRIKDIQTLDGVKCVLEDESWILFRQSGTEPIMRIYSEATSRSKLSDLLDEGITISKTSN